MLEIVDVTAGYGRGRNRIDIVSDISMALPAAHVCIMVGRNGSGKSTILRTISGIQPPLQGCIRINGQDISGMTRRQLARNIAVVLPSSADSAGAGALTVSEVVAMGRHPYTGISGHLGNDDRRIIAEALDAVGMTDKANTPLADLSDGLRQKAMIARALAQQTPIIILDEPTAFLDVPARLALMALSARLAHEHGRTILLSTHDIAPALTAPADSIIVVNNATARLYNLTPPDASASEASESSLSAPDASAVAALNALYATDGIAFDPAIHDFRRK